MEARKLDEAIALRDGAAKECRDAREAIAVTREAFFEAERRLLRAEREFNRLDDERRVVVEASRGKPTIQFQTK